MFTSSAFISLSICGEPSEQRKIHKYTKAKIAREANSVDALHAVLQMSCMNSGEVGMGECESRAPST